MDDETDATSEVARVADVLRVHWLRPTGSRYGGSEPVTTRMCNCMHTLKPQYFEWRHYAEHNAHVAEALSTAGLLRPQIATQEPAGATQGGSGDSRASGGLDGAAVTDWAKVDHTADQCQFEECPSCGCCAHGKEHVIGCSTTLDRPLGTECPNSDCACKGGMG